MDPLGGIIGGDGGNWPCRPRICTKANAAPDYEQHAGAAHFTSFAPRPFRTRFPFCRVSAHQTKKAHHRGELFQFVGGGVESCIKLR